MSEAPVRLCCGQRHYGARCPDGTVMCCVCFDKFTDDQLSTDDGVLTDVCLSCAAGEVEG